jgi:N-acyl-D-aspartate/D-glutamate deacylase
MDYDLIIKHGTIVDGTGAPRYEADLAVANGKIAAIGQISGSASEVIDARNLVVVPGFVDPHTHYDAQICWDPLLTCSSEHGVTSVVIGNCGVGIAPCRPEAHEIVTRDLVSVEGIAFDVLNRGITWDWVSFPQYMAAAQKRGLGINVGFLVPLTPLRHFVLGEESSERAARPEERVRIQGLLREALDAGALGFSTTVFRQHLGYKGRPLACRLADRDELAAYGDVLKQAGKGVVEIALTQDLGLLSEQEYELLDLLLEASARPVTWTALLPRITDLKAHEATLRKAEPLIRRGGIPQIVGKGNKILFSLRDPFVFAPRAEWKPVFHQSVETQKQLLSDPAFRAAFAEGLKKPEVFFSGNWKAMSVAEVKDPKLKGFEDKSIPQVAQEMGKSPVDAFLDLAIADGLETRFCIFEDFEQYLTGLLTDDRTLLGLGDGGAHVDMFCGAAYCTYMLSHWVRSEKLFTLERAVKRMTSEPADFFGLKDRGRLAEGLAADIAIFDYDTVGEKGPKAVSDLPGGGLRLVVAATGMQYTIVNGQVLYDHGEPRQALPGTVLHPS